MSERELCSNAKKNVIKSTQWQVMEWHIHDSHEPVDQTAMYESRKLMVTDRGSGRCWGSYLCKITQNFLTWPGTHEAPYIMSSLHLAGFSSIRQKGSKTEG